MSNRITRRGVNAGIGAALISPALAARSALAQGGEPIKIGFGMALTGPLAVNGQQALLGATDLVGGSQRQGRPARPPGPTHPL